MLYRVLVKHGRKNVFDVTCMQASLSKTLAYANELYPTHKLVVTCTVFDCVPRSAEEEHIENVTPTSIKPIGVDTLLHLE